MIKYVSPDFLEDLKDSFNMGVNIGVEFRGTCGDGIALSVFLISKTGEKVYFFSDIILDIYNSLIIKTEDFLNLKDFVEISLK